jgi:hypothetical protein
MSQRRRQRELADHLRFQSSACAQLGSRLYAELLGAAAADVESGGPAWRVLSADEQDPWPSAVGLRLMGAVNRLVLSGREPELAEAYAEPDTTPEAAWDAFAKTLRGNTLELQELTKRPVQTNEVGRSAALLFGFASVAAETGMPLRLLEVGASAGLNLRWDHFRYAAAGFAWGPGASPVQIEFKLEGAAPGSMPAGIEVAERRGCDPAPIDPATPEGKLTLLAYVWPDQLSRIERMRAALQVAARVPAQIDREGAASWLASRLGKRAPGKATVVFHSVVAQYLGDRERAAMEARLLGAGERATAEMPLAWLRMEPDGDRAAVNLTTWPGGEQRLVARAGYHGDPVELR